MESGAAALHVIDMPELNAGSSLGTSQRPGSRQDEDSVRWFVPALAIHPLGMQWCRVRNPLNGVAVVLPAGQCAVLAVCTGCRALEEHVTQAATALNAPPEHLPAIRECLTLCTQLGLLVSLADMVARCGSSDDVLLPPLGAVVIRTADRPEMLDRLLASATELQARARVAYPWHVVDDSRVAGNRRANRDALARHGELAVTYHDLSEERSLESELAAAFPRFAEEIGWLLGAARGDEATYGRPFNYALLRFAGRRFLVVDDDAMLQPRRSPANGHEFAIGLLHDELRWYADLDAAWKDCPALDVDPLAEHARWLGLPMAQVWPQVLRDEKLLGLTELTPNHAARFRPEARVLFTHNHALGDPGWSGFPNKELALPIASRSWMAANPAAVPFAFDTAFNWRGMPGVQLIPDGFLSTTTVGGVDNTRLLPPTARATRGEDVLLGHIAGVVSPWTWSIGLPFALPHLRATPRRRLTPRDSGTAEPIQFLIHHAYKRSGAFVSDTVEDRMAALAAVYLELGAVADAQLIELLEEQAAAHASRLIFNLNQQLEDETLPAAWKKMLRDWVGSPHLQLDAVSLRSAIAAPATVRTIARNYGRAMAVWPQLWSFCRERFA